MEDYDSGIYIYHEIDLVKSEDVLFQYGCINIEMLLIRFGWRFWIDNLCSWKMECLILYSLGSNYVLCFNYEEEF